MSDFEKQIHAMFDHIWDCDVNHPIFEDTVGELMNAVIQCYNNLPSAEPERKKGRWIATYSDCGGAFVWVSWKCSNCDYVRKKGWKNTDDGKKPDALFCEICGADMRGEQR